ncbi:uncharacterized protein LOC135496780 [Lineus longissimus]|uniref:uncharacterized protein LOC135496780 n=1 Tax=Lineus longissimus TaxID=88925 RepID=UPI00315D687D
MPDSISSAGSSGHVPLPRSQNRGNIKPSQTWAYVLLTVFLAFALSLIASRWIIAETAKYVTSFTLDMFFTIIMTTVIVCNVFFYCVNARPAQFVTSLWPRRSISRLAVAGMGVFLIGATIFDIISAISNFNCLPVLVEVGCGVKAAIGSTVYLILRGIHMGAQLMFVIWAATQVHRGGGVRYTWVFFINIAVNLAAWLYSVVYESKDLFSDTIRHIECNDTLRSGRNFTTRQRNCMMGECAVEKIKDSLETYLYSFHTEFYLIATSILLAVWKNIRYVHSVEKDLLRRSVGNYPITEDPESDDSPHYPVMGLGGDRIRGDTFLSGNATCRLSRNGSEFTDSIESMHVEEPVSDQTYTAQGLRDDLWIVDIRGESPRQYSEDGDGEFFESSPLLPPSGGGKNRSIRLPICLSSCSGGLWYIGLILTCVFVVLEGLLYINDDSTFMALFFYKPVLYLIMTVTAKWLMIKMTKEAQSLHLTASDWILLLTGGAIFAYNFLCILAEINVMANRIKVNDFPSRTLLYVSLLTGILDNLQTIFQCRLLFFMKQSSSVALVGPMEKQALLFLLITNVGKWLTGSFVEIKYPGAKPVQNFYYQEAWKYIIHVTCPFSVYFRFHSAMSMAEFLGKVRLND